MMYVRFDYLIIKLAVIGPFSNVNDKTSSKL